MTLYRKQYARTLAAYGADVLMVNGPHLPNIGAIADTSRDTKVTHALFEMLIPNRLKELAPNQLNVVLVVDEVSGSYPWELLEDRSSNGSKPAAVTSGMLRQLKTGLFRERPAITLEDTVYVVGDPLVTGESAQTFPSLDGARKEAVAVADFLQQNGFAVTRQIRSEAREILAGLHDNGYRILHLAGHGVHEEPLPLDTPSPCVCCDQTPQAQIKKISGMVIGDKVYLTPGDVEQMRWVPELVFINCCHLGSVASRNQTDNPTQFHRLAANIAAQFIRMGVKAVVAAGWAVDDAAAETFATCFYRHLLAADKFGDAVRAAREETYDRHGTSNTWGAYQCYGDPAFRLRPRIAGKKSAQSRRYLSPLQVVTDLRNLTSQARLGDDCGDEVEAVVQSVKDKDGNWLGLPEVASALGLAYGELGMFEQAAGCLDRAINNEKAEYPMRVAEQRANFKSRWAVELRRGGVVTTGAPSPEKLIQDSIDDLDRLLEFNETPERLSLLGSAYKRRAWITKGDVRKESLSKMAEYYRKAHEKKYDMKGNKLDTYPLLNWLAAEILLGWYGEKADVTTAKIGEWCEKARAFAEEQNRQNPSFWNSIVKPECDLVQALADGTLDEQKQTIVDAYRNAKARGASPREFSSVIDHLEFLADIAADGSKRKEVKQQAAALREILEQLATRGETTHSKLHSS